MKRRLPSGKGSTEREDRTATLQGTSSEDESKGKRTATQPANSKGWLWKLLPLLVVLGLTSGAYYLHSRQDPELQMSLLEREYWRARKVVLSQLPQRVFTPEELAEYDGSDPDKRILLGIKSIVFDVTAGPRHYAKYLKGGYSFFSGKDTARAFVTGCFDTHLTHDVRGLSEAQIAEVETWVDFYNEHILYFPVGTVSHPPIDPDSPLPEPCF